MKYFLVFIYLLVLLTPIVTWLRGFNPQGGLYELMRLAGLVTFTLIFCQVVIGSNMHRLRAIFGSFMLRWHIGQGLVAFSLALLHPTLYSLQFGLSNAWRLRGWYSWGKLALVLLALAVGAGLLRTRPWLQAHWRWVHRLNYVVLGLTYFHSWRVGSDTRTWPMLILYWLIPPVAGYGLYAKIMSGLAKQANHKLGHGESV